MRKLLILLFVLPLFALAQDFPAKSNQLVNDFASVMSAQERQALKQRLEAYDKETSVQITVVTMKTLDGYPIDDYTHTLFEKWGIGAGGRDNGVLLLVSVGDRKMWITTGYGLEATLPDATCKNIIENEIKPYFKQKRYADGIGAGCGAMILATKGEYTGKGNGGKGQGPPVSGIVFIVLLIIALSVITKFFQAKRHARLNNIGFWAAWALINAASARQSGQWGHFNSGGGSFGGWSGGGGGGGFGGFGGGHSGGGGAGGSW